MTAFEYGTRPSFVVGSYPEQRCSVMSWRCDQCDLAVQGEFPFDMPTVEIAKALVEVVKEMHDHKMARHVAPIQ